MVVCKTSLIFSYIPLISHECRFLLLGYQQEFLEVTRVLLSPHLWKNRHHGHFVGGGWDWTEGG